MKSLVTLCLSFVLLHAYEFTALPSNKARLADRQYIELNAITQFSTEPNMQSLDLSLLFPLGIYKTLGFSFTHAFEQDSSKGTSFKAAFAIMQFNKLKVGGSVGYLNYTDSTKHHAVPLDLGLNYLVTSHPIVGEHTLGISVKNMMGISSDSRWLISEPQSIKGDWVSKLYNTSYLNIVT